MSVPSKHAALLNRLDEMIHAGYYATARPTLQQAEALIVAQEKEIEDLRLKVKEVPE